MTNKMNRIEDPIKALIILEEELIKLDWKLNEHKKYIESEEFVEKLVLKIKKFIPSLDFSPGGSFVSMEDKPKDTFTPGLVGNNKK